MRGLRLLVASLAAGISIASAPPPAERSQDGILIVGQRNAEQAARDFVKSLALPSANRQLGRFYDPVCPFVAGLSDRANELVAERLRRVAAAAGMQVAKAGCDPNTLLFVVADKHKLLDSWRKSDSPYFGDEMSQGQIDDLVRSTEPATGWQLLDYRGSGGRALAKNRIARISTLGEPALTEIGLGTAIENDWAPISRIINPLRIGFGASILVIDGRLAGGADLRQIADFAAMQLFAHTKLQKAADQAAPTILTLLDDAATGRPAPLSLTKWDLAYLKALYSYTDRYTAGAQRGELAKRMTNFIAADTQPAK